MVFRQLPLRQHPQLLSCTYSLRSSHIYHIYGIISYHTIISKQHGAAQAGKEGGIIYIYIYICICICIKN